MKKLVKTSALLALVISASAILGSAQTAPTTGVRAWFMSEVAGLEKKFVGLAEAVPEDKYTWRPGEGVRSVSEVYLHVALANMRIPTALGVAPPSGIQPKGFEKSTSEKAKVIELLKQAFEHLRQAAMKTSDADLEKKTKLFGREAAYQDVFLGISTHMHEHLGQSIAYARVNKVTPPWSEK